MFPTAKEIFQTGERLLPWTSIPLGRSNNISVWPILSIQHYLSIRMHYFLCISFIWIAAFPWVILIIFFLILEMNVSFKLFSSIWRFASSSRTKKSKRGNNKHVIWSLLPPSLHSLGGCFRDDSKRRSINDNIPFHPLTDVHPLRDVFETASNGCFVHIADCVVAHCWLVDTFPWGFSANQISLRIYTSKKCGKEAW